MNSILGEIHKILGDPAFDFIVNAAIAIVAIYTPIIKEKKKPYLSRAA
jgi:hypothetical protein